MLRPLHDDDLPAALKLLGQGFPSRGPAFWCQAIGRIRAQAAGAHGQPAWGQGLFDGDRLVGVALTPTSERRRVDGGLEPVVNLSSWTIQPSHRWQALFMLRRLLADPRGTYIDLTPTPAVRRMLPLVGLAPVNAQTAIYLLPGHAGGPGRRAEVRPWTERDPVPLPGPEPALLSAHRTLGCQPLLLEHPGGVDLLVYRRVRVRGLPAAQLVYVHSHARLRQHRAAVARHLLGRGLLLMVCDSRDAPGTGRWHTWLRARDLWFARGGAFADRTDFLGSERCLFGV